MSNIFNLFGDSTIAKAPTVPTSGLVGSNATPGLKLRNLGTPGAIPKRSFGQKSKGLTIRSTSDLNIRSSAPKSSEVKKDDAQVQKSFLKPIEAFGKSSSPIKQKSPTKQKSPNKLKSPKRLFGTTNPPTILLSPNAKAQTSEKSEETVFKKPRTPRKAKKFDMDYPEPEVLAPIGDVDIELCQCYDLTNQNIIKLANNKYYLVDEDEGFLSDPERVPISIDEIRIAESDPEDMEIPLPELSPLPDYDDPFSTSDD